MSAIAILLVTPLVAGFASLALRRVDALHALNLGAMLVLGWAESRLSAHILHDGDLRVYHDLIAVDALSVFVLLIITAIGFSTSLYTWSYFREYRSHGTVTAVRLSRYFFLFHMFIFAMILTTVANSLGIVWVALEATTLATTFLINFFKRKASLEAGWKYLILCSVGIALALFGTVLMYFSSVRTLGDVSAALNVIELLRVADQLDPYVVKIAFIFILVGYGTKVGLVPMHTWVPEAYTEAPAPVSAMLAGVLETVAVYAILRSKMVVDAVLSPGYAGNLMMFFGFLSFAVAAGLIMVQRDVKRLLAYSSVEHMGIAMIGFGVGGTLGTFGGLFHLLNHALAKSLAFFAAGYVHLRFGTREIVSVRGMASAQPLTALAFLTAGMALVAMPPLATFVSELSVVTALATQVSGDATLHLGRFLTITIADEARNLLLVGVFLVTGLIVFGGFLYRIMGMFWGEPPAEVGAPEEWSLGHLAFALTMVSLVVLTFSLPDSLKKVLNQAVLILTRGPT